MLDRLERVGEVSGSAIERGGEKKGRKSEKHEWYSLKESSRTVAAEKLVRNASDSSSRKLIVYRMEWPAELELTSWGSSVGQRGQETVEEGEESERLGAKKFKPGMDQTAHNTGSTARQSCFLSTPGPHSLAGTLTVWIYVHVFDVRVNPYSSAQASGLKPLGSEFYCTKALPGGQWCPRTSLYHRVLRSSSCVVNSPYRASAEPVRPWC